jgi:hypothetical protein
LSPIRTSNLPFFSSSDLHRVFPTFPQEHEQEGEL